MLALHRQHLPLHAGGLRGVGAARPHAERGGLPADAGDGDGRSAGAHHLDHARARSPRCRRSTCRPTTSPIRRRPRRSRTSTRRSCSRARSPSSASTPRSIRSTARAAILDPQFIGERHYKVAIGVQRILQRYKELQDIIAILGMDELSRRGQADRRPRAPDPALHVAAVLRGRAVHRHPGQVREARGDDLVVRARARRASSTTCPSRRSSWSAASTRRSRRPRSSRARDASHGDLAGGVYVRREADAVVAPAFDGEVGILPNHAPFMTLLGEGTLTVRRAGSVESLRRSRRIPPGRGQSGARGGRTRTRRVACVVASAVGSWCSRCSPARPAPSAAQETGTPVFKAPYRAFDQPRVRRVALRSGRRREPRARGLLPLRPRAPTTSASAAASPT